MKKWRTFLFSASSASNFSQHNKHTRLLVKTFLFISYRRQHSHKYGATIYKNWKESVAVVFFLIGNFFFVNFVISVFLACQTSSSSSKKACFAGCVVILLYGPLFTNLWMQWLLPWTWGNPAKTHFHNLRIQKITNEGNNCNFVLSLLILQN